MDESLDQIQDELLDRIHAGQDLDREAILAAHPEHAEALAAFLDLLDVVEGADDGSVAGPGRGPGSPYWRGTRPSESGT